MLQPIRTISLIAGFCLSVALLSAQTPVQPCPGYNAGNNTNLACEIPTALQTGSPGASTLGVTASSKSSTLDSLSATLATQLSQLPHATAISGSGLTIAQSTGLPTGSTESLGTILTERGETIGKNKWYLSLTYQRFNFSSIDGISMKNIPLVDGVVSASGATNVETIARGRIDLLVDQFAAVGSFGIFQHVDLTLMVPFAKVTLKTASAATEVAVGGVQPQIIPVSGGPQSVTFLAGSASGPGDVSVGVKANVLPGERTKIAIGGEVRFPTGDASNYLGTGAFGLKPYMVISRAGKRFTPNVNIGYQWNGGSVLSINPNTGVQQNLPSSFLYSGGVDCRVHRRFTLTGEFLGQAVINGPRLLTTTQALPQGLNGSAPSVSNSFGTYAMDNVGVGFKYNPFGGWLITANTLFALDEGGLRSKVIPLVGISYRH